MAYSDKVLDHYSNPRNVGSLAKDDPNVGTGVVGAPECGDVMKLQLKISDDGVVEDAQVQDLRLRQRDRQLELRDRAGEGQDGRRGDGRSRTPHIVAGAVAAAGQDPLLGAGRGRHQGRHHRLEEEARAEAARPREDAEGRDR